MTTQFKRASTFAGGAAKHRSPRVRLGPVRERLMSSFRAGDPEDRPVEPAQADQQDTLDGILPRFPILRQGYDCLAVDEYIAELERELAETDRELAEVRGQASSTDEVHLELKRIGEQTSAVLIAAHEQRDEILRTAREEAERCVAEAAAQATALTSKTEAQLRELKAQKEATNQERERLLDDIRRISAALAALADGTPAG